MIDTQQILGTLVLLLLPLAVWVIARVIFAAYFAAKAEFLRRYFNATDKAKNSSDETDDT